jgi:dihydrofolate synthase/folylpolyglutamate synthase
MDRCVPETHLKNNRSNEKQMTSYEDAVNYINDIPRFTKKTKVAHTRRILEELGNPDDRMKFIHVAGTNGKGSVCAYMDSIFREAGYHTGLFTSPHLVRTNERFKIDGKDVSDEKFAAAFDEVMAAVRRIQAEEPDFEHPTYFETLFLMGILIFRDARPKLDVVILETGMGGRLDATNVIRHPEYCVITSISLDHTQYLGNTIPEIAGEKAGIIKKGVPVIFDASSKEATPVFIGRAASVGAEYIPIDRKQISNIRIDRDGCTFDYADYPDLHIRQIADYQVMNAVLALETVTRWNAEKSWNAEKKGKEISRECMYAGLEKMNWPCRMETVLPGVIIDGAHNPDGIAQFIRTAQRFHKNNEITLLFGAVSDKDYPSMIRELAEGIRPERVVTTEIAGSREISGEIFAELFRGCGVSEVYTDPSPERAFDKAHSIMGSGMLFCVGSLYLAGELRNYITQTNQK